jgi:hypothetical protein
VTLASLGLVDRLIRDRKKAAIKIAVARRADIVSTNPSGDGKSCKHFADFFGTWDSQIP